MDYHWRYAEAVHTDVAYLLRGTNVSFRLPQFPLDYGSIYDASIPRSRYGHPSEDIRQRVGGHKAQIPAAGGECGPRAFFGRFTRKAFGLPTWGVTEPGHAAMSTFSPDEGWYVLLGATWKYAWWGKDGFHRGGDGFQLETQCRENRTEFRKVLRASWLATARGDGPINQGWSPTAAAGKAGMPHGTTGYGEGGLWSACKITSNHEIYGRTLFLRLHCL